MSQPAASPVRNYRGRFAPSPTGPLHFGSLVAAAGSYLDARACGGAWLVRMEDVDRTRSIPGAADDILRTLEAYGFEWDGPVVVQSQRSNAYHQTLHELRARGVAYPCSCSRSAIAAHGVRGLEGYVYSGRCRAGLAPDARARAFRARTQDAAVALHDRLQGEVVQNVGRDIGDFAVYRADGCYTYQLAVVVDDAEQGITDIVRGADLLDSTHRQLWLQQLLDYPAPRYLHLPVAINAAGEKLSKQTLAPAVSAQSAAPTLHAALAFLGQEPPAELQRAPLRDLWRWALAHWNADQIPPVRQLQPA